MLGNRLQWQCSEALNAITCGNILPDDTYIKRQENGQPIIRFSSSKPILKLRISRSVMIIMPEHYAIVETD